MKYYYPELNIPGSSCIDHFADLTLVTEGYDSHGGFEPAAPVSL